MRPVTKALLLGVGTLLAGWVGWGIYSTRTTESVPYERIGTRNGVERRHYPEQVLVQTTASSQRTAFRRLFDYISGENRGDESIPMTAPVETHAGTSVEMTAPVRSEAAAESGAVRMSFYLPPAYDPETAPEPTASTVDLVVEAPKTVAVDRFSWYAPDWRVSRRERSLRSRLDAADVKPVGSPALLRYNDPWTPPFLRRNDVAIPVTETA